MAMFVLPGSQEVVGIVDFLSAIEVNDPMDTVLIPVGVRDSRMWRKHEPLRFQHDVVRHGSRSRQVLPEQCRGHRQGFT